MCQGHTPLEIIRRTSNSAERIHANLMQEFGNARFDIDPEERRAPLHSRTTCAFGNVRINRTDCIGGEMSGEPRSTLNIVITMRGGLSAKTAKFENVSGPATIATWAPPDEWFAVRARPDTVIYALCILPEHLAEAGRATFGERFALPARPTAAPPNGLHQALARNVKSIFCELVELDKAGLSMLALPSFEDLLVGLALAVIRPELLSDEIRVGNEPHGLIARAEEILHERAMEPLSIAAVAAELGVTARALQHAFRKQRGCTPLQFLINRRLALARERLLNPELRVNVKSAAMSCGITNVSRFTARYKETFGELPSETLARGRR